MNLRARAKQLKDRIDEWAAAIQAAAGIG